MAMSEALAYQILASAESLVEGHFVLSSGRHSNVYVLKDKVYRVPNALMALCRGLAELFLEDRIEVVVGPAIGGVLLASYTAYHLGQITGLVVKSVFAEKDPTRKGRFIFNRGYDEDVRSRRVLIVEDIITTGGTVLGVVRAVQEAEGQLVGLGAIWNRGNVSASWIGVPVLRSLLKMELLTHPDGTCPLCEAGIPINEKIGHGAEYMRMLGGSA